MQIKRVTAADADSVGRLAFELFAELAAPAAASANLETVIANTRQVLTRDGSVWAFLALEEVSQLV